MRGGTYEKGTKAMQESIIYDTGTDHGRGYAFRMRSRRETDI